MKCLVFALITIVLSTVKCEICPDTSQCPEGQTCCPTPLGYGCCPQPDAVCCSDLEHCCPEDYLCVTQFNICVKCPSAKDKHFTVKYTVLKKPHKAGQPNVCPGGQEQCPEGKTCCHMQGGIFGCCPMPDAVCCSDEIHCCPNGYTCDASSGECIQNFTKFLRTVPTAITKTKQVNCPDGNQCPDESTCCLMTGGEYGCCPYPEATCCSDQLHCCPNAMKCNLQQGTCDSGSDVIVIPMLKKTPSITGNRSLQGSNSVLISTNKVNKYKDVQCPDGGSCPDGNTCCMMTSGEYGCCPYPQATCCSDELHCCPGGMVCDLSAGTCDSGIFSLPLARKTPALKRGVKPIPENLKAVNDVQCPDGGSCPDGNTCCMMTSGEYGCCPYPQATCCSDELHCCPGGMTCDVSAGTCNSGVFSVPWAMKAVAVVKS